MVASSHIPLLPKASLGFQPVSYASYQPQEGGGGGGPPMVGRTSSFDSDRTNEGLGESDYAPYQ